MFNILSIGREVLQFLHPHLSFTQGNYLFWREHNQSILRTTSTHIPENSKVSKSHLFVWWDYSLANLNKYKPTFGRVMSTWNPHNFKPYDWPVINTYVQVAGKLLTKVNLSCSWCLGWFLLLMHSLFKCTINSLIVLSGVQKGKILTIMRSKGWYISV